MKPRKLTYEELEWLASGDTGMSSQTIFDVMTGRETRWPSPPSDAQDLGRCIRLLDRFPDWRARLGEVAALYPESWWPALVTGWPELEARYAAELVGDAAKGHAYRLMLALQGRE